MKEFLSVIFSDNSLFSGSKEGLPYWTFWFLLCIILLLVIFIFLRDKDLRQRLNSFFFRIKKKLKKFRLQARLKMINKKKASLYHELGQNAWEKGFLASNSDLFLKELARLDNDKKALAQDMSKTESEVTELKNAMEIHNKNYVKQIKDNQEVKKVDGSRLAVVKEEEKEIEFEVTQQQNELEKTIEKLNETKKEAHELDVHASTPQEEKATKLESFDQTIRSLEKKNEEIDRTIHDLVKKKAAKRLERKQSQAILAEHNKSLKSIEESKKKQVAEFQKEIKEWEKTKQKAQDKLNKIENQKQRLFEKVGRLVDHERIDDKELVIFYSKIDRRNKRILDLESQIKELE